MKKLFAILIAACFATSAFATLQLVPDNVNTNSNLNSNQQGQAQGQGQAQAQGQLQGQGQAQFTNVDVSNRISNDVRTNAAAFAGSASQSGAKSSANSGGNVQNVVVTDSGRMEYSGKYEVKNVPSVFSGNVYPTTNCAHSTQVGAAGVGFGLSFGTSHLDEECSLRETARSFNSMGLQNDALHVLCSSRFSASAPSCKAIVKVE